MGATLYIIRTANIATAAQNIKNPESVINMWFKQTKDTYQAGWRSEESDQSSRFLYLGGHEALL